MNPSPQAQDPLAEELIAKLRKYGLDRDESLPHLVISGNLSAGRDSVLRDWKLHTPFSTEIVLRCSEVTSFTIRLIPDFSRPASQKSIIKAFQKSITHIGELPAVVFLATTKIHTVPDTKDLPDKTPWKDVLRIEIEGPSQPHLTLLDIPSLLGNISRINNGCYEDNTASIAETTSFTAGSNTPTHTAITEDFFPPVASRDTVPHAGRTFMIRDRDHGRVIALKEGTLQVSPNIPRAGGCHWICIERDGWFGFRNSVSGQFFGHDGKGKFHCKVSHHRNHEWFCTRAHPSGGHLLLMLHGDKFRQMKIGNDDTELVETDGEGTAWDFIEV
ncbi:hypothetical protein SBOR_3011 [Sclerotinia borealis F-4128]|uniref:Dynamin family protein n=1 Tax=Sclerotinia borealis (strain F-4128) TaxID=1432307 RepID=W9CPT1_SCLBF|nr:hypothetical protein SBOR_3011 [Sclerotinia borealis F-4128]